MLLAFDVGNTNIVVGVYKSRKMINSFRLETNKLKSADEYGMIFNQLFRYENLNEKDITDVIISTVVPSMTFTLTHLSQKYFGVNPIIVEAGVKTGLIVKYDNPKALGADRIVDAVAALEYYPGNCIVMDLGTATTIDAVSAKGEFLGGLIMPGIKISCDALFERTAKLPRIELDAPGKVICRNTIEGIQAGVVYGAMGSVEYIVRRMKKEIAELTGSDEPVKVIATGGLATLVSSEIDCIDVIDKTLTLKGLELIYEKNKSGRNQKFKKENA